MALYEKIQKDPLEFPAEVNMSSGLKRLLTAMMEKEPAKRITLEQVRVSYATQGRSYAAICRAHSACFGTVRSCPSHHYMLLDIYHRCTFGCFRTSYSTASHCSSATTITRSPHDTSTIHPTTAQQK